MRSSGLIDTGNAAVQHHTEADIGDGGVVQVQRAASDDDTAVAGTHLKHGKISALNGRSRTGKLLLVVAFDLQIVEGDVATCISGIDITLDVCPGELGAAVHKDTNLHFGEVVTDATRPVGNIVVHIGEPSAVDGKVVAVDDEVVILIAGSSSVNAVTVPVSRLTEIPVFQNDGRTVGSSQSDIASRTVAGNVRLLVKHRRDVSENVDALHIAVAVRRTEFLVGVNVHAFVELDGQSVLLVVKDVLGFEGQGDLFFRGVNVARVVKGQCGTAGNAVFCRKSAARGILHFHDDVSFFKVDGSKLVVHDDEFGDKGSNARIHHVIRFGNGLTEGKFLRRVDDHIVVAAAKSKACNVVNDFCRNGCLRAAIISGQSKREVAGNVCPKLRAVLDDIDVGTVRRGRESVITKGVLSAGQEDVGEGIARSSPLLEVTVSGVLHKEVCARFRRRKVGDDDDIFVNIEGSVIGGYERRAVKRKSGKFKTELGGIVDDKRLSVGHVDRIKHVAAEAAVLDGDRVSICSVLSIHSDVLVDQNAGSKGAVLRKACGSEPAAEGVARLCRCGELCRRHGSAAAHGDCLERNVSNGIPEGDRRFVVAGVSGVNGGNFDVGRISIRTSHGKRFALIGITGKGGPFVILIVTDLCLIDGVFGVGGSNQGIGLTVGDLDAGFVPTRNGKGIGPCRLLDVNGDVVLDFVRRKGDLVIVRKLFVKVVAVYGVTVNGDRRRLAAILNVLLGGDDRFVSVLKGDGELLLGPMRSQTRVGGEVVGARRGERNFVLLVVQVGVTRKVVTFLAGNGDGIGFAVSNFDPADFGFTRALLNADIKGLLRVLCVQGDLGDDLVLVHESLGQFGVQIQTDELITCLLHLGKDVLLGQCFPRLYVKGSDLCFSVHYGDLVGLILSAGDHASKNHHKDKEQQRDLCQFAFHSFLLKFSI